MNLQESAFQQYIQLTIPISKKRTGSKLLLSVPRPPGLGESFLKAAGCCANHPSLACHTPRPESHDHSGPRHLRSGPSQRPWRSFVPPKRMPWRWQPWPRELSCWKPWTPPWKWTSAPSGRHFRSCRLKFVDSEATALDSAFISTSNTCTSAHCLQEIQAANVMSLASHSQCLLVLPPGQMSKASGFTSKRTVHCYIYFVQKSECASLKTGCHCQLKAVHSRVTQCAAWASQPSQEDRPNICSQGTESWIRWAVDLCGGIDIYDAKQQTSLRGGTASISAAFQALAGLRKAPCLWWWL